MANNRAVCVSLSVSLCSEQNEPLFSVNFHRLRAQFKHMLREERKERAEKINIHSIYIYIWSERREREVCQ